MKIIIATKESSSAYFIKDLVGSIDKKRSREIIFTSDPEKVLREAGNGEDALIISGQVFYHGWEGTELARRVKRINPCVAFYIWSVFPETCNDVDGVLPKYNLGRDIEKEMAKIIATEEVSLDFVKRAFSELIGKNPKVSAPISREPERNPFG